MEYANTIKILLLPFVFLTMSCHNPTVFEIGDTGYCIIGGEGKTYLAYGMVVDSETMYLTVYYPKNDTVIKEIRWNDNAIYAFLSVDKMSAGLIVIDNVDTIQPSTYWSDTSIVNTLVFNGRKCLNTDGVSWFGRL